MEFEFNDYLRNGEDIKNIKEDIEDRFGKIPKDVYNLLEITKIKEKAKEKGILKITQRNQNIIFTFMPESLSIDIDKLINKYKNRIKFSPAKEPYVTYKIENQNKVLEEVVEFLKM